MRPHKIYINNKHYKSFKLKASLYEECKKLEETGYILIGGICKGIKSITRYIMR